MNTTTDILNRMMNAKRAGRAFCEAAASNFLIRVLDVMKKNKYISYKIQEDENGQKKAMIEFVKLNECRVISPRFYVKIGEIDKYVKRYLPARDMGIIIISTNKGLVTHQEAEEKRLGGVLIAYCF